jgi:hypothetical protein
MTKPKKVHQKHFQWHFMKKEKKCATPAVLMMGKGTCDKKCATLPPLTNPTKLTLHLYLLYYFIPHKQKRY